jgi:glycosyltransferase involved in cell wall biosynthesis
MNQMEGMKIVHVVDSMEVGGAETVVARLCRIHRSQGHETRICCLMKLGAMGAQLRDEGFEVDVLGATGTTNALWGMRAYLRRSRPEVVHAHNLFAIVASAVPAKSLGARVLGTRHGLCAPPFAAEPEIHHSIAARCCDWIVAVCDAAAGNLAAAPFAAKSRIIRIYNGASLETGGTDIPRSSRFTLVTVGRLSPAKDQRSMLTALGIATQRVPDLQLLIVGGGALEAQLRRQTAELRLSDRVIFCGEQQHVAPYLRAANLFLLSSVTEGLPLALLEAMACKLPVIVTDVGGMGEVVKLSGCGTIVPPGDPYALADAIVHCVENRASLPELGRRSYDSFLRYFTVERMASEYLGLYGGGSGRGVQQEVALLPEAR